MNRILLEGRDRVIAASRSVRQALILNEGLPPDQVGVIYNGVATRQTETWEMSKQLATSSA